MSQLEYQISYLQFSDTSKDIHIDEVRHNITEKPMSTIDNYDISNVEFLINPTGRFVFGRAIC